VGPTADLDTGENKNSQPLPVLEPPIIFSTGQGCTIELSRLLDLIVF